MNLPTHRSAGYGRTHSSPYAHYMGIEHARKPAHERMASVIFTVVLFGGAGIAAFLYLAR